MSASRFLALPHLTVPTPLTLVPLTLTPVPFHYPPQALTHDPWPALPLPLATTIPSSAHRPGDLPEGVVPEPEALGDEYRPEGLSSEVWHALEAYRGSKVGASWCLRLLPPQVLFSVFIRGYAGQLRMAPAPTSTSTISWGWLEPAQPTGAATHQPTLFRPTVLHCTAFRCGWSRTLPG